MIADRRVGAGEQFASRMRARAVGVLRGWQSKLGDIPAFLLLILPFATVALITGLNFRLIGDESVFSLKVIRLFASTWPRLNLADYPVTSTPLAYILLTGWGKIVGFEIWKLRSLTAVVTFLAAWVFYKLCKWQSLPYPLLSAFIFLFFPYVFFLGFTIYPDNFALPFGIGALYYYLSDDGRPGRTVMGSVLETLAIYCRQSYIVIPCALLGVDLLRRLRSDSAISDRLSYWRPLILAIPILMFMPIYVLWGGATPPMTRLGSSADWFLAVTPHQVNYILVFVGFYFAPVLFRPQAENLPRAGRNVWLLAFGLLMVYISFPVQMNEFGGHPFMAGIVIHGLSLVGSLTGDAVGAAAKLALWVMGLIIVSGEWRDSMWTEQRTRLMGVALGYAALMVVIPLVYERYYGFLVPILILVLHRSFQSRRVLGFWLAMQAILAGGYSFWRIVMK